MSSGAEGAAGVDHHVDRALARLLPGGTEPEAIADQERFVEVLPAVRPVVGHLGRHHLDQAVAGRDLDLAQLRQLALATVDRVLDVVGPALLLDSVGGEHGQLSEDDLRLLGPAADGEANQPKALRTREKKPSSPCWERRLRASSVPSSFSASSRCSSLRSVGMITWMTMRRSPGGPPLAPGSPWPRRANWVPCWIPGGSSISRSPSWLGIVTDAPNMAWRAEISTACMRSWPRIGPRRTSKPKAPPKTAEKMSSTELKPWPPGGKPPERRPSWPKRS